MTASRLRLKGPPHSRDRGIVEYVYMLSIGLCDDEGADLEGLRGMVERYASRRHVPVDLRCFTSGEDLLFAVEKGASFDIVFLDVYMGLANGVDVARELRSRDQVCSIVFATNSRGHAIDGYGVRALQYLLKPLSEARVESVLDLAIEKLSREAELCALLVNKQGSYRVPLSEIIFVESNARVISVHTKSQGRLDFYERLDDFESRYGDGRFLRCHKSFLVNMDYVYAIEGRSATLEAGQKIRISIGLSQARAAFASYTARKL